MGRYDKAALEKLCVAIAAAGRIYVVHSRGVAHPRLRVVLERDEWTAAINLGGRLYEDGVWLVQGFNAISSVFPRLLSVASDAQKKLAVFQQMELAYAVSVEPPSEKRDGMIARLKVEVQNGNLLANGRTNG